MSTNKIDDRIGETKANASGAAINVDHGIDNSQHFVFGSLTAKLIVLVLGSKNAETCAHPTSTCGIGKVVDSQLTFRGAKDCAWSTRR